MCIWCIKIVNVLVLYFKVYRSDFTNDWILHVSFKIVRITKLHTHDKSWKILSILLVLWWK
jgi:hypothetical protein